MRRRERNARRPGRAIDRRAQRLGQRDHFGGRVAGMDFVAGDDEQAGRAGLPPDESASTIQRAGDRTPVDDRRARSMPTALISSITSIGSDRNTGPVGAAFAVVKGAANQHGKLIGMRRPPAPTSLPAARSAIRSPNSSGSVIVWRESCCPAVTTSGVCETLAFSRLPMPCPSPPAV